MPEMAPRIKFHREESSLFAHFGIEDRLAVLTYRKVELPSCGNIVIEQTEALVSIDINSAKNREGTNVQDTALMTNLEAVQVITEQLVLRDLGGIVIIDFIDMEKPEHQRLVQLSLRKALLADIDRTHVEQISRFGLIEMTRQRRRPSHKILSSAECPMCAGTGVVKTNETLEIECVRALTRACNEENPQRIEVIAQPDVAVAIMNGRRMEISKLEQRYDCRIVFQPDAHMKVRGFRLNVQSRRGRRRQGRRDDAPVHPGLIAPMLEEQARIANLAREQANKKPSELLREIHDHRDDASPAAEVAAGTAEGQDLPAAVAPVVAAPTAPTVWEEAHSLRDLLFTAPQTQLVGKAAEEENQVLDSANDAAKTPPRERPPSSASPPSTCWFLLVRFLQPPHQKLTTQARRVKFRVNIMQAVIDDRGRQYSAKAGDRLTLDRLDAEVGSTVERSVLLTVADGASTVGTPTVEGVKATLKVLAHVRGNKGTYGFFRKRKDSRRRIGFRHDQTTVEVVSVG